LIDFARRRSRDARASFATAGVGGLPRRPGGYGVVGSLLALNFFPDPAAAVREMRSVAAPGGMVSACVWDYLEGMELLRRFWDAAVEVDAKARDLDEGRRFPLCRRDALTDLFHGAGLGEVRCEAIVIPTEFPDFDDLWRPLLGGTGPAPAYVAALDEDRRVALERTLEETLPRESDGSIRLTARAWAVRGTARRGLGSDALA
jgi:hypothetical protein